MEGQHTGSFPRVCSERSANSRAPGHLVGLGDPAALPGGWDSFPRQWQVTYPLAGLFSSPGHCSPSPCCPPAALSQRSRSRSAGWGMRSRLPLPSAGAAGPVLTAGSHNNPRPAGRAEGVSGGAGVPLFPSALGGRWVPKAPGPGQQLPRPRWRPPNPERRFPGAAQHNPCGDGACGGLRRRRAVPAVPNGRPRPDIKAEAAALLSLRRPGPPEPPLPAAAAMDHPPPLLWVLGFLSLLLLPLLPLAGSAAGAGTRRAREPGPRGAGQWGVNPCLIPRGCARRSPHQGSLLIPLRWAVGGRSLPLRMFPFYSSPDGASLMPVAYLSL